VQTSIIDQEDKRLGWIVTLIDISERKRTEVRLEQLLRIHDADNGQHPQA
jgi:hypothetical protein